MLNLKRINMSHKLSAATPAYSGVEGIQIKNLKCIEKGDSCNQTLISMTNHIGTHVDVPYHFIQSGKTITDYDCDDWHFLHCCLIDCFCEPGALINSESLLLAKPNFACDLLLIRTYFERFRGQAIYWEHSPIFHENLGGYFEENFPNLKAIALDTISLSSLDDREMGRAAHRSILGRDIRIFEDVAMQHIESQLREVWALPLLLENADGAQVTMIGFCELHEKT